MIFPIAVASVAKQSRKRKAATGTRGGKRRTPLKTLSYTPASVHHARSMGDARRNGLVIGAHRKPEGRLNGTRVHDFSDFKPANARSLPGRHRALREPGVGRRAEQEEGDHREDREAEHHHRRSRRGEEGKDDPQRAEAHVKIARPVEAFEHAVAAGDGHQRRDDAECHVGRRRQGASGQRLLGARQIGQRELADDAPDPEDDQKPADDGQ
jgi:hypothetical protein